MSGKRRKGELIMCEKAVLLSYLFSQQTLSTQKGLRASIETCTLICAFLYFPLVLICPPLQVLGGGFFTLNSRRAFSRPCSNMLGRPTCLPALSFFPQTLHPLPLSLLLHHNSSFPSSLLKY